MSGAGESDLVGTTLAGKFAIISHVGSGAMASVYKARHLALDKIVALKIMHRVLATDPMFAARFHREAQMASRLDHPSSIRTLDFGEEPGGLLYIAMEFVDGRDLHELISNEWPLGDGRVVRILAQVLSALSVAHELGIVHRDLKPENIMVVRGTDEDGDPTDLVKVCDFGIAKIAEPRSDKEGSGAPGRLATASGFVVGTPEYMAPEQARGEPVDARADLYAVGVVLYRMLTRALPFQAETALGVAVKHIYEAPSPPSRKVLGVSPRLEAVCLKAIRKDPADRYQSAREMRADLRAALGAEDETVPSDPAPSRRGASPIEAAVTLAAPLALPPPERAPFTASPTIATAPPITVSPTISATPVVGPPPGEASRAGSSPRRRAAFVAGAAALLGLTAFATTRPSQPASSSSSPGGTHPDLSSSIVDDRSRAAPSAAPVAAAPSIAVASAAPADPASAAPSGSIAPISAASGRAVALLGPPVGRPGPTAPVTATTAEPAPTPTPEPITTTAPPAPTPTPPPPSATTAAPAVTAAVDIESARVSVGAISTTAGLPASSVKGALARVSFARCYKDALRAAGAAAASASGTAHLHLAIDDSGYVTSATASGMSFLPGAKACIEGAARGLRVPNVDTGEATADLTLTFSLR